jgi:hypothetical protein
MQRLIKVLSIGVLGILVLAACAGDDGDDEETPTIGDAAVTEEPMETPTVEDDAMETPTVTDDAEETPTATDDADETPTVTDDAEETPTATEDDDATEEVSGTVDVTLVDYEIEIEVDDVAPGGGGALTRQVNITWEDCVMSLGCGLPAGGGVMLDNCHPRHLDNVAARYPGLHLVAGRPGWPWHAETIAVLLHKRHVWYELHGWSPKYHTPDLKHEIARRLKNRILFAADYPLFSYERLVRDWRAEGYPEEVEEAIIDNDFAWMAENRERILEEWTRRYEAKAAPRQ